MSEFSCKQTKPDDITLFPIVVNGKMGFIDSTGAIKIKPIFDYVTIFHKGLAVAVVDSNYGYINKTGEWVIKPRFSIIHHILYGTNSIPQKDYTYEELKTMDSIHSVFKKFLKTPHDTVFPYGITIEFFFVRGLAVFYQNGKGYGYINQDGNIVINPQFSSAGVFSGGLAPVSLLNGKLTYDEPVDTLFGFRSAGKRVITVPKYGYIDTTGKWVIKPTYDYANYFSGKEKKASVFLEYKTLQKVYIYSPKKDTNKFYNYDSKGLIINPQNQILFSVNADRISYFSSGYAICENDKKQEFLGGGYSYVDSTGKTIGYFIGCKRASYVIDKNNASSNGSKAYILLLVKHMIGDSAKWGFIKPDLTSPFGVAVNEIFKYDDAVSFSEGLAAVKINDQWGYIDIFGNLAINPNFTFAGFFNHGLAYVEQTSGNLKIYGYINKKGVLIWHRQIVKF